MNQQRRTENSSRWTASPERGSEYLQGDFWAALQLEDDKLGPHDIAAPPIFENNGTLSPFVPEMMQVGPASPLIFPVLGLDIKTPRTAVRHVSDTAAEQEDYLTIAWDDVEDAQAIQVDPPPEAPEDVPVAPIPDRPRLSIEVKPTSRHVGKGFKPPPMLGPRPRPALPSLSSAPVIPSWRRRGASTSRADPTIRIPLKNDDRGRVGKDGNTFDSQLLDSLVDCAWSEPATPITPIDDTNGSSPYVAEDDHSWTGNRDPRALIGPRYDVNPAELGKVMPNQSQPHGRASPETYDTSSRPMMPHRSGAITPRSILKQTEYKAPELNDWF